MFYLSTLLYLCIAILFVLRYSKEIRISVLVISLFITITSTNILVIQVLHFMHTLNNPLLYLLLQSVFCAIYALILFDPLRRFYKDPITLTRDQLIKPTVTEGILTFFIIIILIGVFFVGTLSPINNSDSLQTHLPRIFYWLQHGSLESWYPTATTQISYPVNITFLGLWTFILSRSEMYFFLPMWLGLAATISLTFEIALILGCSKMGALIAGLVTLSFPVVLMQTYSYQGDVIVTAQVLCSIFLLLQFSSSRRKLYLFFSLLILAIAVGSKQTALLFIPIYVLALLILLVKPFSPRLILQSLLLSFVFFGAFSSLKYIQNLTETKADDAHMINPRFFDNLIGIRSKPFDGYLTNGFRYLYQAISLDGLNGQIRINLEDRKEIAFRKITSLIGIDLESQEFLPEYEEGFFAYNTDWPVNEDASWFGPLSFTLLPFAMVTALISKGKRHKWYLLFAFLLLLVFVFGQVILKADGWGANRGRHMTIAVLAITPLLGFLIPKQRITGNLISLALSIFSVYLAFSVLLINDNRPIITTSSIYTYLSHKIDPVKVTNIFNAQYVSINQKLAKSLLLTSPDRTSILENDYYGRLFYQDKGNIKNIILVNSNTDQLTPLYLLVERTLLEYALFGHNRTRELYPVKVLADIPSESQALILNALIPEIPPEFQIIKGNEEYTLLYKP